jgi:hypothetical protein
VDAKDKRADAYEAALKRKRDIERSRIDNAAALEAEVIAAIKEALRHGVELTPVQALAHCMILDLSGNTGDVPQIKKRAGKPRGKKIPQGRERVREVQQRFSRRYKAQIERRLKKPPTLEGARLARQAVGAKLLHDIKHEVEKLEAERVPIREWVRRLLLDGPINCDESTLRKAFRKLGYRDQNKGKNKHGDAPVKARRVEKHMKKAEK